MKPFYADYASKLQAVENGAAFHTHTHSPYKISQFTSYLKLLLLPELKYGEHLLPVGENFHAIIDDDP